MKVTNLVQNQFWYLQHLAKCHALHIKNENHTISIKFICQNPWERRCVLIHLGFVGILGGGLFIGNLNDMHGYLWNETPSIWGIYKEKKKCIRTNGRLENILMYSYYWLLNLMWWIPPLHTQNVNHEVNRPLLHIQSLSLSNERESLCTFSSIGCLS